MAIYDKEGQLTYKDEAGNSYLLHPKTKMNCVYGLEEALGEKAPASHAESKNNPHGVSADQVGARPNTWMPTAFEVGATPASHATNKSNPHGVTAAQVGARPSSWMPTAEQVGAAPMEYAKKVGNPHNLLDNSDFRNPVNQRNVTYGDFAAGSYIADRWAVIGTLAFFSHSTVGEGLTMVPSDVSGITQRLPFTQIDIGETYTFAVKAVGSGILVASGKLPSSDVWSIFGTAENKDIKLQMARYGGSDYRLRLDIWGKPNNAVTIQWAALYKGEYTAETLPEYQPKGCAAELLECQRYFLSVNKDPVGSGYIGNNNVVYLAVPVPVSMRVVPTVVLSGNLKVWSDGKEYDASNVSVYSAGQNSVTLKATVSGATAKKMAAGYVNGTMFLDANM